MADKGQTAVGDDSEYPREVSGPQLDTVPPVRWDCVVDSVVGVLVEVDPRHGRLDGCNESHIGYAEDASVCASCTK